MGHPWPCNSCCQVHVATAQEVTNVGCIVPLHITLQTQSAKESSTLLFLFDTCSRRYIHVCTCLWDAILIPGMGAVSKRMPQCCHIANVHRGIVGRPWEGIYVSVCSYMCARVCVCVSVCACVCVFVCAHCVCVYMYISTYVHMYVCM